MEGSRKAAQEFMHCIYVVQQAMASVKPPTSPIKPTQPVMRSQHNGNVY
jgi:hypothetical protein